MPSQGDWQTLSQLNMPVVLTLEVDNKPKGQEIALLDRKLSQILGEPERETQVFDDEVKRKVSLFQRWQNMYVDGIAGEQTLRRLELLTQQDAPKLDAPKLGASHLVGGA